MEKKEFLEKLARALAGQVSQTVIEENLRYYETYLSDEAAKGRKMHQILEELGDPRLLAKSIIDANGGGNRMAGIYEDESRGFEGSGSDRYQEEEEFARQRFRQFQIRGFWVMVLLIVVFCLFLMLVGTIIGGIFLLIRPIILPLLIIWLVYWIFRGPYSRC